MTDLTTYAQEQFMNWSFLGTSMPTAHGTVYIALHTADPGDQPDGSTEVGAADYDRASVTADTTEWTLGSSGDATTITNDNEISFGIASSDWGTITHFSVWDGADSTTNPLWAAALDTSRDVQTDDEIRFLGGSFEAQID